MLPKGKKCKLPICAYLVVNPMHWINFMNIIEFVDKGILKLRHIFEHLAKIIISGIPASVLLVAIIYNVAY